MIDFHSNVTNATWFRFWAKIFQPVAAFGENSGWMFYD